MQTTVAEIHAYPVRPPGFQEVLFPSPASKREVADHLLEVPWLHRASEMGKGSGEAPHMLEEPIELKRTRGRIEILRPGSRRGPRRRRTWKRRTVEKVVDNWREVGRWWEENERAERMVFRVLLACGSVVDLSRDGSGEWFLAGIVD